MFDNGIPNIVSLDNISIGSIDISNIFFEFFAYLYFTTFTVSTFFPTSSSFSYNFYSNCYISVKGCWT